jgi:hypothetical protein
VNAGGLDDELKFGVVVRFQFAARFRDSEPEALYEPKYAHGFGQNNACYREIRIGGEAAIGTKARG